MTVMSFQTRCNQGRNSVMSVGESETKYRICPICEATCGLEIKVNGREIGDIRGYKDDVFSQGFICPKGVSLRELDADADRLRVPLIRRGGELREASWEEAYAEIEKRVRPIIEQHGRDSVGVFVGNPSAHKVALGLYLPVFRKAVASRNMYSASTLDQMPKQVAVSLMYGDALSVPVPDLDRADLHVVMGANPIESNGSMWTVPDFRGRVKRMQKRGGRLVVIDPRKTRTAKLADDYLAIKPGTDAYFLAALVQTMFAEDLVDLGAAKHLYEGVEGLEAHVKDYTPDVVAGLTGVDADSIRQLARDLVDAQGGGIYGRIGTTLQEFGTVTSWLIEVVNILSGNVDVPGGMMFPKAVALQRNASGKVGPGMRLGRYQSRVRGADEVMGDLPAICLAEEIETPGEGQIRALFTVAGNPVLSAPDGDRLGRAMDSLDFMVSVDIYLSETSRHADVVLPGTSPFEECQFDIGFNQLSVRNAARFSPTMFPPKPVSEGGRPQEWQIMLKLANIVAGRDEAIEQTDDNIIRNHIMAQIGRPGGLIEGRDPEQILQELDPFTGPERQIDLAIRTGPYGDGFGANPDGLTLQKLIDDPKGVDLGPLQPRLDEIAGRMPGGFIDLAPAEIVGDMTRLASRLARDEDKFLMVGRRSVRTNNSWLHNLPLLAKGPNKCTLQINSGDAASLGIVDGGMARVSGDGRDLEVQAEVTDEIMPGVVSIPHGFGHHMPGTNWGVASAQPGVNSNHIANNDAMDPLSGTAVLNGIPVDVTAA
jgi:anaerobic selenocysteine-containing dehydrogenase